MRSSAWFMAGALAALVAGALAQDSPSPQEGALLDAARRAAVAEQRVRASMAQGPAVSDTAACHVVTAELAATHAGLTQCREDLGATQAAVATAAADCDLPPCPCP